MVRPVEMGGVQDSLPPLPTDDDTTRAAAAAAPAGRKADVTGPAQDTFVGSYKIIRDIRAGLDRRYQHGDDPLKLDDLLKLIEAVLNSGKLGNNEEAVASAVGCYYKEFNARNKIIQAVRANATLRDDKDQLIKYLVDNNKFPTLISKEQITGFVDDYLVECEKQKQDLRLLLSDPNITPGSDEAIKWWNNTILTHYERAEHIDDIMVSRNWDELGSWKAWKQRGWAITNGASLTKAACHDFSRSGGIGVRNATRVWRWLWE